MMITELDATEYQKTRTFKWSCWEIYVENAFDDGRPIKMQLADTLTLDYQGPSVNGAER